jgi:hypothetical protein
VYIPHFLYPFICWLASRLSLQLGHCVEGHNKHGCAGALFAGLRLRSLSLCADPPVMGLTPVTEGGASDHSAHHNLSSLLLKFLSGSCATCPLSTTASLAVSLPDTVVDSVWNNRCSLKVTPG